jgi:hypothetical protein
MKAMSFAPRFGSRTLRFLLLAALLLTLAALLITLQFVIKTTGGTLFLFSTFAPALVVLAIAILLAVTAYEYHESHKLFNIERFVAGQIVFRQGDEGGCAYFIREGEVEVIGEEDGRVVATLGPGSYFGEMSLLSNAPRNATVRAKASAELAVLGKRNFLKMMEVLPETEEAILSTVQKRAMERASNEH